MINFSKEEIRSFLQETVVNPIIEKLDKRAKTDSDLLSVEEVAKYLKCAPQTIYQRVNKGEIPHIKDAKKLYFRKSIIDAWLDAKAVKATEEKAQDYLRNSKRKGGKK